MENDPTAPAPQGEATKPAVPNASPAPAAQSGAGHIDMGKVLLPKKEIPGQTLQSAQRINAGVLLEQENLAATEGTAAQEMTVELPPTPAQIVPEPKKEESMVHSLETYKGDIERVVQEKNISVVSIAAAEATRRGNVQQEETAPRDWRTLGKNIVMIAGGIFIIVVALGIGGYVYIRQNTTLPQTIQPSAPFVAVDDSKIIPITPDQYARGPVMSSLNSARQNAALALGLIERLLPVVASSTQSDTASAPLGGQRFLTLLAPDVPQDLLRNTQDSYLLGIHIYDGNQPFLILKVDSYESAYAGMLAWESTLPVDLAPLFTYAPRPRIPEENIATSSSTSSLPSVFAQTGFVDKIVENHDARVLVNQYGDIYLLWTFLDRNTLLITTNDATVREIISRLQNAPITPIPGQ